MKSILNEIKIRGKRKANVIFLYIKSLFWTSFLDRKIRSFKTLSLFIGYGRSGHTLFASLLNAHPQIAYSIECGVLYYTRLGFGKNQLISLMLRNYKNYSKENSWSGYSYAVKGLWQGDNRNIAVLGDKHGGVNSRILLNWPDTLRRFEKKMQAKAKLIHVVRNPFDIITTYMLRSGEYNHDANGISPRDLLSGIKIFFDKASLIEDIILSGKQDIITIHHERFLAEPENTLTSVFKFLEVDYPGEPYFESCRTILFDKPKQSRHKITWPHNLICFVEEEMQKIGVLRAYSFEGE